MLPRPTTRFATILVPSCRAIIIDLAFLLRTVFTGAHRPRSASPSRSRAPDASDATPRPPPPPPPPQWRRRGRQHRPAARPSGEGEGAVAQRAASPPARRDTGGPLLCRVRGEARRMKRSPSSSTRLSCLTSEAERGERPSEPAAPPRPPAQNLLGPSARGPRRAWMHPAGSGSGRA